MMFAVMNTSYAVFSVHGVQQFP